MKLFLGKKSKDLFSVLVTLRSGIVNLTTYSNVNKNGLSVTQDDLDYALSHGLKKLIANDVVVVEGLPEPTPPKPEAPKVDPKKIEPKVEPPKVEIPKVEEPVVALPAGLLPEEKPAEAPKEEPRVEEPKTPRRGRKQEEPK